MTKKKKPAKLRPVLVTWDDHCFHAHGWADKKSVESLESIQCQTAGFLTGNDSKYVKVSLNFDRNNQVGETMVILRKYVRRIQYLR